MPTLHLPQKLFISGNICCGLHHLLCLPPAHLEVAAIVAFVCFGPTSSGTLLIDLLTSLRATNPTSHVAFAWSHQLITFDLILLYIFDP